MVNAAETLLRLVEVTAACWGDKSHQISGNFDQTKLPADFAIS